MHPSSTEETIHDASVVFPLKLFQEQKVTVMMNYQILRKEMLDSLI